MAAEAKVYDFSFTRVQDQVRKVFSKFPRKEATVADIINASGLPKFQIEQVMPAVVEDCRGQMKATDQGDLIYYFPKGMASNSKGFKAWFRKARETFLRASAFLFKAWIMVMLVGYFVLFVTFVVLAFLASIAIRSSSDNNRSSSSSSGGLFGGYFMVRIIDLLITFWIWREPTQFRGQGMGQRTGQNLFGRQRPRTTNRAFYKSVFAYVFGEEKVEETWKEREKLAVLSKIKEGKGVISLEEIMAITGKDRESANAYVSRLLLEFEGDVQVSDQGTLYYSFPEVLRTVQELSVQGQSKRASDEKELLQRPPIPFNNNGKKTNRIIGFFNGFNLIFGAYFTIFSLLPLAFEGPGVLYTLAVQLLAGQLGMAPVSAISLLLIGFGIVPMAFSLLFYLLSWLRRSKDKKRNRQISVENTRRSMLHRIFQNPSEALLNDREQDLVPSVFDTGEIDVKSSEKDSFTFQLSEFQHQIDDLKTIRKGINPEDYHTGSVVFDSGS